jgi:hypothetical protein
MTIAIAVQVGGDKSTAVERILFFFLTLSSHYLYLPLVLRWHFQTYFNSLERISSQWLLLLLLVINQPPRAGADNSPLPLRRPLTYPRHGHDIPQRSSLSMTLDHWRTSRTRALPPITSLRLYTRLGVKEQVLTASNMAMRT